MELMAIVVLANENSQAEELSLETMLLFFTLFE